MDRMDRRAVLKTGGMAILGIGLGGCSARSAPATTAPAAPAGEARTDVEVAAYEPKMNVTPNAVALKE